MSGFSAVNLYFSPFSILYSLEGSHYELSHLKVESYAPSSQRKNIYTSYLELFCIGDLPIIYLVRKSLTIITTSFSIEWCQAVFCAIS